MAFRAAMTGHQVYSTLHTNSAVGAFPRLLDIGIVPDILAGNIIGIIAQRLVRRLCRTCRQSYDPDVRGAPPARPVARPSRRRSTARWAASSATTRATSGRQSILELLKIDAGHRRADRAARHRARDPHRGARQRLQDARRRRRAPGARGLDLARRGHARGRPDRPHGVAMPLFSYKAIDAQGKSVVGRLEAVNLFDLEQRLQRMELDLVGGALASDMARLLGGGKVTRQDLINFCFHLEQLATAGVPLVEGLTDLRDSVENPRFREVVSGLIESIQGGQNLSQALADYPNVFGRVFVSLVRSGEPTGKLADVLKSLSESLKWEDELAAQTKKLAMYPRVRRRHRADRHLLPDDLPGAADDRLHPQHGAGDPAADAHPDGGVELLRRLLVGDPRRAVRRLVRPEARDPHQPGGGVRGRPLQDLDAADRPDPAQDHPVALRLELRHDVQLGHHRARRDPQLRGDRRQPSARARAAHRPASRSPRART